MTLGGQAVSAGATRWLWPGRHRLVVKAPGKVPQIRDLRLKPAQLKTDLNLELKDLPQAVKLLDQSVESFDYQTSTDTVLAYLKQNRTIVRLRLNPQAPNDKTEPPPALEPATAPALPELTQIAYSPDFNLAVLTKSDGEVGLYDFARYDLLNQEFRLWSKDIISPAWRPDGQQILYLYAPPGGERSLIATDRKHQQLDRLFDARQENLEKAQMSYAASGELALIVGSGNLYLFTFPTKVLTKLVSGGVEGGLLSPKGTRVIFSQDGQLKWIEFESEPNFPQGPDQTELAVGRIAAANPNGLGLNGQISQVAFLSEDLVLAAESDRLVKIRLSDGKRRPFFANLGQLQPDKIKLTRNLQSILFLAQGSLWQIELEDGQAE